MAKFGTASVIGAALSLALAGPASAATRSAASLPATSEVGASRAAQSVGQSDDLVGIGFLPILLAAIAFAVIIAVASNNDSAG